MPKKKPAQKNQPKSSPAASESFRTKIKEFISRHKIISILFIAAVLWALVWLGQVGVERYRFEQAEKKLDSLASEIQAVLPQDKILIKEKSCAYSSRKFSRGDRSCSMRYSSGFTDYSLEEANSTANRIQEAILASDKFEVKHPNKDQFPFRQQTNLLLSDIQRHTIDLGIQKSRNYEPACSTEFTYDVVPDNYDNPKKDFNIVISCYGSAKADYFPVRE